MSSVEIPTFTWIYALIITCVLLALVSFFKPKHDYKPFSIDQFDNNCGKFCLARIQWWTVRFIFYYVKPMVAGPLFFVTIILIATLAAIRLEDSFYEVISSLESYSCDGEASVEVDLIDYSESAQFWSDQLTWMLTIYFFQKLFGATLFLNGGGLATIASMVFDPWLYLATLWGTVIFYNFMNVAQSSEFETCINSDDSIVDDMNTMLYDMNAFTIILWILCALSLPFGILIDYFVTVFREWKYASKKALNQENLTKSQKYAEETQDK